MSDQTYSSTPGNEETYPEALAVQAGSGLGSWRKTGHPAKAILEALKYLILIVGLVIVVAPFVWMISTSLTPAAEVFSWPPKLIPDRLAFENYIEAITTIDMPRYFLNSVIVTVSATLVSLVLNSLGGYALAKLHFPGRKLMFIIILGTIMIPPQVTMIPLFIMLRHFPLAGGNNLIGAGGTGLIDTYAALVLPNLASTFGVYMMREFFRMLPSELIDAARVDGANEFTIFWKIFLPLATPALVTTGLFNFTFVWNDFLWPLIMTSSPEMRTLQLGLSAFKGQYFTDWHLMMAATVLTSLPILIIYLIFQRYFVKGVAMSGLKG